MRLQGKSALVTGAGRGIGAAIARRFAQQGAKVLCCDRDGEAIEQVAAQINAHGGTAVPYIADVADPIACRAQVDEAVRHFGRLHIAVNNAGISQHKLVLDMSFDEWQRVLDVNLSGSFSTAQAAARHMVAEGGGRIVQIGSISGQRGNLAGSAYGCSKAAVMHLCKVMAVELSQFGVMINAIAPGPIETGISVHGPSRKQGYLARIPSATYGTVDAVANAALFLASDECQWTTGTVLNVDGGYGAAGLSYDRSEVGA